MTDYICSMVTRFKHCSFKTTDFNPLKLQQQTYMRARLFLCETSAPFFFAERFKSEVNGRKRKRNVTVY